MRSLILCQGVGLVFSAITFRIISMSVKIFNPYRQQNNENQT